MNRGLIIITSQAERDKASRWAQGVSSGTRIEFKEPKRTLPQNDRFWAMLTDIAEQMKERGREYDPAQWKVIFMAAYGHEVKFLPSLDQKSFIPVGHSSSDLGVREMSDLMEFMSAWAAENGIQLNDNTDGEATGSSSVSDAEPDAPSSSQAGASNAGEDAPASTSASPAPILVRYARDVLNRAAMNDTDAAVLKKTEGVWATELSKLPDEDREKAQAIAKSMRAVFSDPGRLDGVLEHYAEMLGVDKSALAPE
jgi:hypothetical protein